MCAIGCEDINDYDVEIDAQLYNHDYDEIVDEQSENLQIESDILFE